MAHADELGDRGGGFIPASEVPDDIRELLERGGEDRLEGLRRFSDWARRRLQATSREP
ncbi:hypothetical protein AB1207_12235 [Kineococcus endophyticus]|uniref:Uncharacterized protein n=1 Tax=Kineococcus endophyticus TaxID=1181883 RepID=A0ABV3P7B3_9ACTN